MTDTNSPVFGTYSLPALRGALLDLCNSAADNKLGRWYISLLRKTALAGLYSPTSWKAAKDAGKVLKAFAVEPDDTNGGRLCFNTQASHADIVHIPFAVGGSSGVGKAVGGETNRGEVRIAEADKPSDSDTDDGAIIIKTLADIVDNQHVDEIDAMKVDVEGHDFAALEAFFQQALKTMWPKLLIIETGRGPSKVLELCVANGYSLDRRTQINAILTLSDPAGNE